MRTRRTAMRLLWLLQPEGTRRLFNLLRIKTFVAPLSTQSFEEGRWRHLRNRRVRVQKDIDAGFDPVVTVGLLGDIRGQPVIQLDEKVDRSGAGELFKLRNYFLRNPSIGGNSPFQSLIELSRIRVVLKSRREPGEGPSEVFKQLG